MPDSSPTLNVYDDAVVPLLPGSHAWNHGKRIHTTRAHTRTASDDISAINIFVFHLL